MLNKNKYLLRGLVTFSHTPPFTVNWSWHIATSASFGTVC